MKFVRICDFIYPIDAISRIALKYKRIEVDVKDGSVKVIYFDTPEETEEYFNELAEHLT